MSRFLITLRLVFILSVVLVIFSDSPLLRAADPPKPKPFQVFILAGQSNMEGKAKVSLLEYQVKQPATRPLFAHF